METAAAARRDEAGRAAGASAPLVRIRDLRKGFGRVTAVDAVDLDVAEGECFCLLGPSGCGKTTLLRLVGGFEQPDGGRIELDGRDIAGLPPHRRPLNTMFQSYALFPHLRVGQNIAYGLKREGLPRQAIAQRVEEMLRLVRLDGLADRFPAQISGGQRQRVALARALARRPRLLLLDEPLGALDRRLREETQLELKALQTRLRTTFVIVTHDQDEAMVLGDRIGVMDRGRLVQVGPPREVYRRPLSTFVAGFLGEVNLLRGRFESRRDGCVLVRRDGAPGTFTVAAGPEGPDPVPGAAVTVAVRPENLDLDVDPAAANAVAGRLAAVAYRGGALDCRVALGDGTMLRASRPDRAQPSGAAAPPLEIGRPVILGFRPDAAVLIRS